MLSFKNSILADEDLISIFAYTYETWDLEQAHKYKDILEKGRLALCSDPFLIGSKSRVDLADDCRIYRVEHHYFVYRLKNEMIEIARILHENMDFHTNIRNEYFPL